MAARTDMHAPRRATDPPVRGGEWYRQPVLWLGAVLLAASIGGCMR